MTGISTSPASTITDASASVDAITSTDASASVDAIASTDALASVDASASVDAITSTDASASVDAIASTDASTRIDTVDALVGLNQGLSTASDSMFSKFDKIALSFTIVLAIFKGLAWSLIVPPFYGFDEPLHFIYGRKIEQTHNLRVPPNTMVPLDIWELDTPPAQRTKLRPGVEASSVYVEDKEQGIATQPGFSGYHPPFYYAIVAVMLELTSKCYVLWQVLACRLLSVALGAVTAACAYFAGKFFLKEKNSIAPLTLASLVVLHPMSAFSFGLVSNSVMEITLFSLLSIALLRTTERKTTWQDTGIVALLMWTGLMTKLSFLAAVPVVVLAGLWQILNRQRFQSSIKSTCAQLLMMLVPGILSVSLWFSKACQTGGDTLAHSWETKGRKTPFNVIDYLSHYHWFDNYSKTASTYFGHFGWKDASIPVLMIVLLVLLFVGAAVYCNIRAAMDLKKSANFQIKARSFAILLLSSATISWMLFYAALDMRLNAVLGGWFSIRGQYYLAAIIGQLLSVVLLLNWKNRTILSTFALTGALVAAVWLNFYALIRVVSQYHYGSTVFSDIAAGASKLQPVSADLILNVMNLFGVACGAVAILAVANLFMMYRTNRAQ
ncbi:MAG TPA: DUF2142 domain-containing protein [Drouetiella sp.]